MKMTDDVVFTTDEAARYLRVSKPTLFKHIHLGKIKAIKVGKNYRFLQSDLYRFLKGEGDGSK